LIADANNAASTFPPDATISTRGVLDSRADFGLEHLHVSRSQDVPQELCAVTDRDVRLDLIEEVWDEFVRIAASIRSGECTAVEALTRFKIFGVRVCLCVCSALCI
jgi:hypothetical protein